MRAAVLDCGTNTFHLLVAEYDARGNYTILENQKRNVKLGEGGILQNEIGPKPFDRGIREFSALVQRAKSYDPDVIKAFATSAVRGASNGREFVKQVHESTGIHIEIIDGDREAHLIYKGVKLAFGALPGTVLVMDIGGGSTEFILASGNGILWKRSFELGVSRLLQRFQPSDPIRPEDVVAIEAFFKESLESLAQQVAIHNPTLLIGCSGSFESFASMIMTQLEHKAPDDSIRSYFFREVDFQFIHSKLLASDEDQRRKNMPGLVEARVDTIVYAGVFIDFVKRHFRIPEMVFSNYALKEGAFSEIIMGDQ